MTSDPLLNMQHHSLPLSRSQVQPLYCGTGFYCAICGIGRVGSGRQFHRDGAGKGVERVGNAKWGNDDSYLFGWFLLLV
jgi:hypothetical protein